jgi:hypothetical protein
MIPIADAISLTISRCLQQQGRIFIKRTSLLSGVNGFVLFREKFHCSFRRSIASGSDEKHPKPPLNPAASFHFASTDFTSCFLHVPQAPNPDDVLRTAALHYLNHIFDPTFWFNDPVSSSLADVCWKSTAVEKGTKIVSDDCF